MNASHPPAEEFDDDFDDPGPTERCAVRNRTCLMCGETFESAWSGHRMCGKCKSLSVWRQGGYSLGD